jgi:hypothetical protein
MIITDGVADKIRDLVDSGYLSEAQGLDYQLKSVADKVNKLVGERGGQVKLSTYERQILELPVTVAEELPLILAGYKKVFGMLMAVGMGLNLREAALAAKKSVYTNDIELYDPKDESYDEMKKSLQIEDDSFNFQPNLFDETHPPSPKADSSKDSVGKYVPGLNPQQALEAENQLIQATVSQLMGPAQEMQQMMQQQQQQAEQQQQGEGPDSLLEALSGEKKSDKPKTESKEKSSDSEDSEDSSKSKSDDDSDESDSESDDDSGDDNEKLGKLLADVQDRMPKLMELHDKNPEAFKKVVTLIHKLVGMVKSRKEGSTKKFEVTSLTEELNKALKIRYPVGTVKNRKKKVIVDGKAKWRSVAAGQVQDDKGNAISVESHNSKAGDQGAT